MSSFLGKSKFELSYWDMKMFMNARRSEDAIMARLSQTNPELFENPTLGEATTNPYLDQQEAQAIEDYNARVEGREPRIVVPKNRYPQFMPAGSVPSSVVPELEYVGDYTPGSGESGSVGEVAEEEQQMFFTTEEE